MKYRNPWPVPKRGKARSNMKRPAAAAFSPMKSKPIPYVRFGGVKKNFHKDRVKFGVSVHSLIAMTPRQLIRKLTKDGLLPSWQGSTCPHCGGGSLGKLHFFKDKQVWVHRCTKKRCMKRVQPHDFHAIFYHGSGNSYTPLGHQVATLRCALAGVPITSVPTILDMDHKSVNHIYQNLECVRARHVQMKQKTIDYGALHKWNDVEADEVDLGKELLEDKKTVKWEQWGGIVERGQPHTLALFRLHPKMTKARAPGPGPIQKSDWTPIATRFLKNKQVILHTDGARTYKLHVPGVLRDNVVHKKKRVLVQGKYTWVKPHYTKVTSHTLCRMVDR